MWFMAGVSSIAVVVLLPEPTLSISPLFAFVKHSFYTFNYIHREYKSLENWLTIAGESSFLSSITSTFKAFVDTTRRTGSHSLLLTPTSCIHRITCQSPLQSDQEFTIKAVQCIDFIVRLGWFIDILYFSEAIFFAAAVLSLQQLWPWSDSNIMWCMHFAPWVNTFHWNLASKPWTIIIINL